MGAPRTLRIALVIDQITARTGGTEGQILQLVDRLDRSRFEPVLFCLRGSPWLEANRWETAPQVLDLHVQRNLAFPRGVWAFSRRLRRERFDVVQTYFRDGNLVGVLAARLAGVPLIVSTRRGLPYWSSSAGLWLLRWLDRQVDEFVANSEATRRRYAELERFPLERCHVIYNGLDPARFRTLDEAGRRRLRRSLGLLDEQIVVGIVANLRAVKGIDEFLQAAALLVPQHPHLRFVVIGGGPQEAELLQLREDLGLREQVLMLGSRDDAAELMQCFDVGVLASHFESFSNSILEYVAAGLPVVVTDVGGAREVVTEGREGFLVPPGDASAMAARLGELLDRPGGPRALRRDDGLPERFRIDAMVGAYERLYETLEGALR